MLIDGAAHSTVTAQLQRRGFVPLVTPGRGRGRFFVRFDAATGSWPKLDIVTRLSFGPHKEINTHLAEGVLARRARWGGGLWTAAGNDTFWLLLLHALLDKGEIRAEHRQRLALLRAAAEIHTPPARLITLADVPGASPSQMLEHVESGRWDELERLGPQILRALRHRQRARSWVRHQRRRVVRRLPPGVWPGRRLSIAILAADADVRGAVAGALVSRTPLPTIKRTGRLMADRLQAPPGGLVLTSESAADLVIIVGGEPLRSASSRRGQDRVFLDQSLPVDELARRALAASWSRYVALRVPAADRPEQSR